MADRGALPLLRPLLPRPSIFLGFSHLHVWRLQKPKCPHPLPHLLYYSSSRSTVAAAKIILLNSRRISYKVGAVSGEGSGSGGSTRGKRGRKRRQLWEELLEDNVEDDDDDDGGGGNLDLWKILEEIVENVWILKAFKSYGYLLPFIILSLFFSTGPKAFLISLGVAIGPSLLFLAFQKLIGWDKRRRALMANQFGMEEEEVKRRSSVRYSPLQVRNNVNGRGINRGSAAMSSKFGGWDELDGLGTVPEQPASEPKRKQLRKKKKIRREAAEPLLRLLVSLFPFLSSYTNLVK